MTGDKVLLGGTVIIVSVFVFMIAYAGIYQARESMIDSGRDLVSECGSWHRLLGPSEHDIEQTWVLQKYKETESSGYFLTIETFRTKDGAMRRCDDF